MKRAILVAALPVLFNVGCASAAGIIPMGNRSSVDLRESNFRVVRTNMRGEASCGYLFGLIPLGDPSLATRAMDALSNAAQPAGKAVGLVNVSFDLVNTNFFGFYLIQTVVMRADAVEFGASGSRRPSR